MIVQKKVKRVECMRIHCLQPVPFEAAEEIAGWAEVKGHALTTTRLYESQALPAGARRLASSLGCAHQCFEYEDYVVGLQFHLEVNESSIRKIMTNCAGELEPGEYIQAPSDMTDQAERITASNTLLFILLDAMEEKHLSSIS